MVNKSGQCDTGNKIDGCNISDIQDFSGNVTGCLYIVSLYYALLWDRGICGIGARVG